MDLFAFIYVADPTKVKTIKRERVEEEAKLLDSTIGRVVPLLPVALARAKSKLEASVEKLFDECGSTEQGDFAAGGGHDAEIELITTVKDTAAGNVTVERLKSLAMLTLPFVTSLVSATPEPEGDALLDSVSGGNLCTISSAARFVISSDSSHHSSTNASGAEVDSVIRSDVPPPVTTDAVITTSAANVPPVSVLRVADKVTPQVQQSIFHESTSADTIRPDDAG
nr:hypothetical protein [Tanacetum cinerariifolium]